MNDIVDMALGETTVPNLAYVDFLHWNQTWNDGNVALLCLAASIVLAVIFWRIGRTEKSLTKK